MNKDLWDKLGVIASFIQIVVIGAFTVAVSFYSAKMTNKLNFYKGGMDENEMISKLVNDLSNNDSASHLKTDFALLSLDRYLLNTQKGKLQPYDQEMLSGFAQSIILDRIFKESKSEDSTQKQNEIFIEGNFLKQHDSLAYVRIIAIISAATTRSQTPSNVTNSYTVVPVNQVIDTTKTQTIGLIFNKTCYIQYSNLEAKSSAQKVLANLTDGGWSVPVIQNVRGNYATLIKYFHKEDADNASRLKDLSGLQNVRLDFYQGYESKVPLGQLEIWIGNNL